MIKVDNLTVSYGDFTLRNVNLELRDGGTLAILGPSGAGKTLLLETVMGARQPGSGHVLLDGRNITDLPPESRQIAYIPQDLALFPHLSVRQNIVFGLDNRAARKKQNHDVTRIATLLNIEHLLDRQHIATLSGGEKQRVALARALIVKPRVLFLDEPFAALDAATAADLLHNFRGLRRDLGATIFLVTHDLDEACYLADDVAIMMAGRIVDSGPVDRVIRRPQTVEVARFLNIRNILPLSSIPPEAIPVAKFQGNGITHWAVRAEDIGVYPWDANNSQVLRGRLEELIPVGSHVVAHLTVNDRWPLEAALSHADTAALMSRQTEDVAIRIAYDRILYLTDQPHGASRK